MKQKCTVLNQPSNLQERKFSVTLCYATREVYTESFAQICISRGIILQALHLDHSPFVPRFRRSTRQTRAPCEALARDASFAERAWRSRCRIYIHLPIRERSRCYLSRKLTSSRCDAMRAGKRRGPSTRADLPRTSARRRAGGRRRRRDANEGDANIARPPASAEQILGDPSKRSSRRKRRAPVADRADLTERTDGRGNDRLFLTRRARSTACARERDGECPKLSGGVNELGHVRSPGPGASSSAILLAISGSCLSHGTETNFVTLRKRRAASRSRVDRARARVPTSRRRRRRRWDHARRGFPGGLFFRLPLRADVED